MDDDPFKAYQAYLDAEWRHWKQYMSAEAVALWETPKPPVVRPTAWDRILVDDE